MSKFKTMTSAQFAGAIRAYSGKAAQTSAAKYWDMVFTGVARYYGKTGNIEEVNKLIAASRAVQRHGDTVRVLRAVIPHTFDAKADKFVGKMQKSKAGKLVKNEQWQTVFADKYANKAKKQTQSVWKWARELASIQRKLDAALEHGDLPQEKRDAIIEILAS